MKFKGTKNYIKMVNENNKKESKRFTYKVNTGLGEIKPVLRQYNTHICIELSNKAGKIVVLEIPGKD